jgi:hypothetical protein
MRAAVRQLVVDDLNWLLSKVRLDGICGVCPC